MVNVFHWLSSPGIRPGWIHHFRTSWAYPDDTIHDDADTPTSLAAN
jgi:hypothetical protein